MTERLARAAPQIVRSSPRRRPRDPRGVTDPGVCDEAEQVLGQIVHRDTIESDEETHVRPAVGHRAYNRGVFDLDVLVPDVRLHRLEHLVAHQYGNGTRGTGVCEHVQGDCHGDEAADVVRFVFQEHFAEPDGEIVLVLDEDARSLRCAKDMFVRDGAVEFAGAGLPVPLDHIHEWHVALPFIVPGFGIPAGLLRTVGCRQRSYRWACIIKTGAAQIWCSELVSQTFWRVLRKASSRERSLNRLS